MGTSGAYTGAGGKPGKEVSEGLGEWLGGLPSGSVGKGDRPESDGPKKPVTRLPPRVVKGLVGLLGPTGSGGGGVAGRSVASGGSGRTRTGSGRSAHRLASVSSRAAAGAYAFVHGDAAGLRLLGLDYDELRGLDDPIEVTRRIVDAVCGHQANGALEVSEERYVAASVADWLLAESEHGELPDVDDIARYAMAAIVTEVLSSEIGAILHDQPEMVADPEEELRDAAMVLAGQAEFSASGPTAEELTKAIEEGIEKLREIYGGPS